VKYVVALKMFVMDEPNNGVWWPFFRRCSWQVICLNCLLLCVCLGVNLSIYIKFDIMLLERV